MKINNLKISKMSKPLKVTATNPDDLHLTPGTHGRVN